MSFPYRPDLGHMQLKTDWGSLCYFLSRLSRRVAESEKETKSRVEEKSFICSRRNADDLLPKCA